MDRAFFRRNRQGEYVREIGEKSRGGVEKGTFVDVCSVAKQHVARFRRTVDAMRTEEDGILFRRKRVLWPRLTRDAVKYATDRARFSPSLRPACRHTPRVLPLRFLFSPMSLLSFRGSFY